MNRYFKFMLAGILLMFGAELILMFDRLSGNPLPDFLFAGLVNVFLITLLSLFGWLTARNPFPVGIIAIGVLAQTVIYQFLGVKPLAILDLPARICFL